MDEQEPASRGGGEQRQAQEEPSSDGVHGVSGLAVRECHQQDVAQYSRIMLSIGDTMPVCLSASACVPAT